MRVGGLGEFENIRKAVQKDEPRKAPPKPKSGTQSHQADAIEISPEAKALGQMRQFPDVRQDKIEKILSEMENGTLMTPEAVKESVARMLENMLKNGI